MNSLTLENITLALTNSSEILGKDKYFNSAVLVPLIIIEDKFHFLFEKRSNHIRQGGEVSFPGGEFDNKKDQGLRHTAIRETSEELGLSIEKIKIIGKFGTLVAPMGVTVDAFVGILTIKGLDELAIDINEVEKVFLIPVEYFLKQKPEEYKVKLEVHPSYTDENGKKVELLPVQKLGLPSKYSKPWKNGLHRILVYNSTEEVIWGITAEIVYELCRLINSTK
ncbi:MAG: CoA pyrophosphatase [Ignavibacteriota bacterium]|nr:CoA pyrophosphatase [Ignavibacteriales bacterium]MCE7857168.1 CoA pyrophosphatase [Ignavibacteria bacterium CHB3]QKJ97604.1 MAG: CoA pyrophosphatase [Ignavibacteriota bacterium]GIK62058.1 MAG: DNA mismatch repair protein MutT [Ignavibacteriota bacterium]